MGGGLLSRWVLYLFQSPQFHNRLSGEWKGKHMNQLLGVKSLRLLPLIGVALLFGHSTALLGKIADADYFERQNHRDLNVIWSADSKACVVVYEGRFGFDTISVLQLKGSGFQQTDLGRHIEKALAAAASDEGTGSA